MNRIDILDFEGSVLCWTTWTLIDFNTDELPQHLRLVAEPVNPWKIVRAGYARTARIATGSWNTSFPVVEDRRLPWSKENLGLDGFRVNQDWVPESGEFVTSTVNFTVGLGGRGYEEIIDAAMEVSC